MKISGTVAIVIGGARGIGRAYVDALLQKQAKVVFGDILHDTGKITEKELREKYGADCITFVPCDITVEQEIEAVFQKAEALFGHVSVVANSAGLIDEGDWTRCIDINLGGVIRLTQVALRCMSREHHGSGGVIVHTSSMAGLKVCHWGPVYAATKSAIVSYVRGWAALLNYQKTGVRHCCICPGTVDTALTSQAVPGRCLNAEIQQKKMEQGEKIRPAVVAEGFIHLVENDEVNGCTMRVTLTNGIDFYTHSDQPMK